MIFKIPNILTIGRLIMVPVLVFFFYLPGQFGDWLTCGVFVLASFTDFVDGFLARLLKQQTKLGELLDPIADKILVVTALVLLVMNNVIQDLSVIAAIIIICREILVSGLREYLAKFKLRMPVSQLAKIKTFLQMFSISILLAGNSEMSFCLITVCKLELFYYGGHNSNFIYRLRLFKKGIDHAID